MPYPYVEVDLREGAIAGRVGGLEHRGEDEGARCCADHEVPRRSTGCSVDQQHGAQSALSSAWSYIEPLVVPKGLLTGDDIERVDARILQVVYERPTSDPPLYIGTSFRHVLIIASAATA
jgi:hypothetical protein